MDNERRVFAVRAEQSTVARLLRLPRSMNLDLTYRCNNCCRHCWLWRPVDAPEALRELTFPEIRRVVDEARALGCQRWSVSGGEPMLRPDFSEILDYITRKALTYTLNTNGSLITPAIAQLLKRKGSKLVALYGATAEVHDQVTRTPGSFEATMRGFSYLREAGAGFMVQLIPLRDNYHQWAAMRELAASLSPHHRVGASWLYLSAYGSEARNREIIQQRLSPGEVVALDGPGGGPEEPEDGGISAGAASDDRLFAACIAGRRDFHVDPYGGMTFCEFVRDPALRYDLRQGTVAEGWEKFIPSLADRVRGDEEYRANCGSCAKRADCRWCAVYGYLEQGRFSAPVRYLCAVTDETRRVKQEMMKTQRRFYRIAGITIQVEADLPLTDQTFSPQVEQFHVAERGDDTVVIRHHVGLPETEGRNLGAPVYRKAPWAIYHTPGGGWTYTGIAPDDEQHVVDRVAVFNEAHTRGEIYNSSEEVFQTGRSGSLTFFPTDQILIARLLADRNGCLFHAAGMILEGQGLLFMGHSSAGKSTTVTMLRSEGEILCDDRLVVRRWPEGWKVHGTWSHGDVLDVSPAEAPLRAVLLIEKASENRLIRMEDYREIIKLLPFYVIKPLVTADWWEKTLTLLGEMVRDVPVYRLQLDKSGQVREVLRALTTSQP